MAKPKKRPNVSGVEHFEHAAQKVEQFSNDARFASKKVVSTYPDEGNLVEERRGVPKK